VSKNIPRRILALGAHPDDIEIGCGGTLMRYADLGSEVYLYIATKGEKGGDPMVRAREAERSADRMGANDVIWGGFIDCEIPWGLLLIQNIEKAVKRFDPDMVFVHYSNDTHQDHRGVAMAAQSAARRVPDFLFYESPTTQEFIPTVYCDIQPTITKKVELLECHFSQVARTNIEGLPIMDIARSSAMRRGMEIHKRYAEGFKTTRFLLL